MWRRGWWPPGRKGREGAPRFRAASPAVRGAAEPRRDGPDGNGERTEGTQEPKRDPEEGAAGTHRGCPGETEAAGGGAGPPRCRRGSPSSPQPAPAASRGCPGGARNRGLPVAPGVSAGLRAAPPSPGLLGKGQSSAAFSEPARTRSSSIAAPSEVRGGCAFVAEPRGAERGAPGAWPPPGAERGEPGGAGRGRHRAVGPGTAGPRCTEGLFSITKELGEGGREGPGGGMGTSHACSRLSPPVAAVPGCQKAPTKPPRGIRAAVGARGSPRRVEPPPHGAGSPPRRPPAWISFVPAAPASPDGSRGVLGGSAPSSN